MSYPGPLDLYRAIGATGHADRLAREHELSVKTRVNLASTHGRQ
jgi:hypothetical protein